MIYTQQTQEAMNLCYHAHKGQVDKSGVPYVFHPIHLAEQMDDEISTVVALLHDVVEDTPYTFRDLENIGFAPEAIAALKLLTHDPQVDYMDYVREIAKNPIARKVKMADLRHNMDETRLKPTEKVLARRKKYAQALAILQNTEPEGETDALHGIHRTDAELARLNQMNNRRFQDRIRGSLIGGAAGDALGYEVEFEDIHEIRATFGACGITDYVTHQGFARVSDDTQMSLFTAAGLLRGTTLGRMYGNSDAMKKHIYEAYLDWLETQYDTGKRNATTWLNQVSDLYAWRAPGNTCLSALNSGAMGTVAKPINHSKGCGGVMRVAPIGLFCKNCTEQGNGDRILEIMALGGDAAAITHGHPLGYIPAAALVHIVNRIVYGGCKYGHLPEQILRECKELLVALYGADEHTSLMLELIDLAAALAVNGKSDVENIHKIGGGWVGDEALAIALYCWLRYPADFDKALIAAVNHSGDADSTGAILGNIMGACVGYDAIDARWTEELELCDVILEIADDLCAECQMRESGTYRDEKWLDKYVSPVHTGI